MMETREQATPLLRNELLASVVASLVERAEHIPDEERLVATFVDPGVLPRLENQNNQVLYGRRGTGKTHILKVVGRNAARLTESTDTVPVYIDISRLGDTQLVGDTNRSVDERVAGLLVHMLKAFRRTLRDSLEPRAGLAELELERHFERLDSIIHKVSLLDPSITSEQEHEAVSTTTDEAGVRLSPTELGLMLGTSGRLEDRDRGRIIQTGRSFVDVDFTEFNGAVEHVLGEFDVARVLLLIDEWSDLDLELQPHLAQFVRKSFFRSPRCVVKIAAIKHRSKFSAPLEQNRRLGFEHGADITAALDLDEFFVFDPDQIKITRLFANLLYRQVCVGAAFRALEQSGPHRRKLSRRIVEALSSGPPNVETWEEAVRELASLVDKSDWWGTDFMSRVGERFMEINFGVLDSAGFETRLFETPEDAVFGELIRASGGVVRDFLKIFSLAFARAHEDPDKERIDTATVRAAARDWYVNEKTQDLTATQSDLLASLVAYVLGNGARCFLIERKSAEMEASLSELFDRRLVHLVRRGFGDIRAPGQTVDIYALDYGCYVDYLDPDETVDDYFLEKARGQTDLISPFRGASIPRVMVGDEVLVTSDRPDTT
jgi:hypothetical protein